MGRRPVYPTPVVVAMYVVPLALVVSLSYVSYGALGLPGRPRLLPMFALGFLPWLALSLVQNRRRRKAAGKGA